MAMLELGGWIDAIRSLQDEQQEPEPTPPTDSAVLLGTLILYGPIFLILWTLFSALRKHSPRTYNLRSWVETLKTKLADNQFGFFSWIWNVYSIPDRPLMDECGMDAACLVRILQWAFKVACVGAFNALWLIPVYGTAENEITDPLAAITLGHVPMGSQRTIATMIAAYIVFGCAMFFLYQEFKWYTALRCRFLTKIKVRNYAVYVHGIPEEFKSDIDLVDFFQEAFGIGRVQEAHIRLDTPDLADLVSYREDLVQKLEHAINVKEVKGETPTHKEDGEIVNSIGFYASDLKSLNEEIANMISELEMGIDSDDESQLERESLDDEDGAPLDGGFVSFYHLSTAQAALQMNHSRYPFQMQAIEAPDPHDILWTHVGKSNSEIQTGKTISFCFTAAICLLWTIPVLFFSTISDIEGLESALPFIKELNENAPFMRQVFAQLAPFLLVIVNALLPIILRILSTFEGLISNGTVNASLFSKLAIFVIVQTFFISLIASGDLLGDLPFYFQNPAELVNLLAQKLPSKYTYFLQLIIISTVIGLGMELLRVSPAIMAGLRSCIGPNLTEKEKNSQYLFLRPISIPPEFPHATALSQVVFASLVMLVYSVISPIANIVLLMVFLILGSGYRHQFIYIYQPTPDSGGQLWLRFVRIIIVCMIVAQIIIAVIISLKGGSIAAPLMIPLILATIAFRAFLQQRHFEAAKNLPSHECAKRDIAHDFDVTENFEGLYLQPELRDLEVLPDNISSKLRKKISLIERRKKKKQKRRKRRMEEERSRAKTEPIKSTNDEGQTDEGDDERSEGVEDEDKAPETV